MSQQNKVHVPSEKVRERRWMGNSWRLRQIKWSDKGTREKPRNRRKRSTDSNPVNVHICGCFSYVGGGKLADKPSRTFNRIRPWTSSGSRSGVGHGRGESFEYQMVYWETRAIVRISRLPGRKEWTKIKTRPVFTVHARPRCVGSSQHCTQAQLALFSSRWRASRYLREIAESVSSAG